MQIWVPIDNKIVMVNGAVADVALVLEPSCKGLLSAAPDLYESAEIALQLADWIQKNIPEERWPHGLRSQIDEVERAVKKAKVGQNGNHN